MFKSKESPEVINIPKKNYFVTTAISAITFPILMLLITQLTAFIIPSEKMSSILQLEIGSEFNFYLGFYLCFILTGALLPSFYLLTAYRWKKPKKQILFALIYSLLIWTPVVLAMYAFGINILLILIFAMESILAFIILMAFLYFIIQSLQNQRRSF